MFRQKHRLFTCLLVVGLTGCASTPEIPFDHAANPGVQAIGVLQPAMSPEPTIWLASDIGQTFGLIGNLVDAEMQANRDKKFSELLAAQGVKPNVNFLADVHAALAAHGYSVSDVAEARSSNDLLKTYPRGGEGVDAYLDVAVLNYGYVAAGIGDSTPYRPFLAARCRLVRASDGAVLMEDTILYNPVSFEGRFQPKAVTISPDPAYVFTDFDSLTADPTNAVKGMNGALSNAANSIGMLVQ